MGFNSGFKGLIVGVYMLDRIITW